MNKIAKSVRGCRVRITFIPHHVLVGYIIDQDGAMLWFNFTDDDLTLPPPFWINTSTIEKIEHFPESNQ